MSFDSVVGKLALTVPVSVKKKHVYMCSSTAFNFIKLDVVPTH